MGEKKTIDSLIEGGKATGGPPLGPALGPLGVNVPAIVNRINELTKDYSGMKVPVKVVVDVETKNFDVEIGTPTTSALIVKELGIEKGSANPKTEKIGNLSFDQIIKIAKLKQMSSYAKTLKACVKEIVGACNSMGVTIEDEEIQEILEKIDAGKYDDKLS